MDAVDKIEKETVDQASPPSWFQYRKGSLAASMNNQIKMKFPKTDKGFMSAAEVLLKNTKVL